jgi:predicted amidohydrolase
MKFALVSLNQHWENKDLNKKRINKIVEKLSNYKLDWAIFPEMTLTGFSMNCDKIADKKVVSTFLCKFFIERQIRMHLTYFCMSPAHLHF